MWMMSLELSTDDDRQNKTKKKQIHSKKNC